MTRSDAPSCPGPGLGGARGDPLPARAPGPPRPVPPPRPRAVQGLTWPRTAEPPPRSRGLRGPSRVRGCPGRALPGCSPLAPGRQLGSFELPLEDLPAPRSWGFGEPELRGAPQRSAPQVTARGTRLSPVNSPGGEGTETPSPGAGSGTWGQATRAWGLTSPPAQNASGAGKGPGAETALPARANAAASKIARARRGPGRSGGCRREPPPRDGQTERSPRPAPTASLGHRPSADDTRLEEPAARPVPWPGAGGVPGARRERRDPAVLRAHPWGKLLLWGGVDWSGGTLPQFPHCSRGARSFPG